jgi:hypothetical protein
MRVNRARLPGLDADEAGATGDYRWPFPWVGHVRI